MGCLIMDGVVASCGLYIGSNTTGSNKFVRPRGLVGSDWFMYLTGLSKHHQGLTYVRVLFHGLFFVFFLCTCGLLFY